MWMVQIALRRPYTFVVLAILILLFGTMAAVRTPKDVFPSINIPVVAVVFQYYGMMPSDVSGRFVYFFERTVMATNRCSCARRSRGWCVRRSSSRC